LLVKILSNTLNGMFAPIYAAWSIVVRDKPAVTASFMRVAGKEFYLIAALRANFDFYAWRSLYIARARAA
jgi:hypothetical protein